MRINLLICLLLLFIGCQRNPNKGMETITHIKTISTDTTISFPDISFTYTPVFDSTYTVKKEGVTVKIKTRVQKVKHPFTQISKDSVINEVTVTRDSIPVKRVKEVIETKTTITKEVKHTPTFTKFLAWAGAIFLLLLGLLLFLRRFR